MHQRTRLLIAAFLGLSAACRPAARSETASMGGTAGATSAGLSAQDRSALEDLSHKWEQAATAGDANAISALYTSDAVLLPDNAPMAKGDEVKSYWTGFTKNFSGRAELKTTAVDGRGDLAYAVGTFKLTPKAGGQAIEGKWITLNKKQPDGSWKMAGDIWNLNAPPGK